MHAYILINVNVYLLILFLSIHKRSRQEVYFISVCIFKIVWIKITSNKRIQKDSVSLFIIDSKHTHTQQYWAKDF